MSLGKRRVLSSSAKSYEGVCKLIVFFAIQKHNFLISKAVVQMPDRTRRKGNSV